MLIPTEKLEEEIPKLMLLCRGNLAKISRDPTVNMNAMELRYYVATTPSIRQKYHQLLAEELQDHQLHIAERILRMAELQSASFGDPENDIPPDPKTAIDLSKEISRLIAEGSIQSMSTDAVTALASKEDVQKFLARFIGE